jgi:hypothetical protein
MASWSIPHLHYLVTEQCSIKKKLTTNWLAVQVTHLIKMRRRTDSLTFTFHAWWPLMTQQLKTAVWKWYLVRTKQFSRWMTKGASMRQ